MSIEHIKFARFFYEQMVEFKCKMKPRLVTQKKRKTNEISHGQIPCKYKYETLYDEISNVDLVSYQRNTK